jgi:Tol biopolymer transport system component
MTAAAVIFLVTSLALASYIHLRPPLGGQALLRYTIAPPANVGLAGGGQAFIALSPDGRKLAFVGLQVGQPILFVRSLDALDAQPLAGTGPASRPFWSPDSRTLGFFQAGKLRTIDVSGGPVQTVCDLPAGLNAAAGTLGATWNRDGTIVFSSGGSLFRVPAIGGTPALIAKPDVSHGAIAYRLPSFLSDGRHFLFDAMPGNTTWVASLDSAETTKLVTADSQAQYADGHLFFVR